ncbi:MAG TPA: mechanosensitive ion channel [Clostridia bacterium]|nr:mechanosensitive ion channel [Clostridia bacterium]
MIDINILYYIFDGFEQFVNNVFGNFTPFVETIVDIALDIMLYKLIMMAGAFLIRRFFKARRKRDKKNRADTLLSLFLSIWRYFIYFMLLTTIIEEIGLGVTAGSLLATAGIGGLAVGFSAQSIIRDVISGIFILFEDYMAVGDFVSIGAVNGTVEEIRLRTTVIRALSGERIILPNGSIDKVTNYSRGQMLAVIDVSVGNYTDYEQVQAILTEICDKYHCQNPDVTASSEILGITGASADGITIRIITKTKPMQQFVVERELAKEIVDGFKARDMTPPVKIVLVTNSSKGVL